MAALGGDLAGVATIAASAATAFVTYALGRRSQNQKQAEGAYGELWKLYQDRTAEIGRLKADMAADKRECQEEIARERVERETEVAAVRTECEERVAEADRRHGRQLAEVERRLEVKVENYRRDRDYWRAKAQGKLNGGDDGDTTPPPEPKR